MGYSRIALATLLVLGLLEPIHGAQSEPFLVELKGPDEPTPAPQTPPVSPAATPQLAQPAPQPQSLPPASAAQTLRYGPILRSDTLWSLANKYRPSRRVSVYQTMVAIFEKNPASFADGNINHLLVGSSIALPSEQEARRISEAQARARFRSDNASWKGISPKYTGQVKNLTVHAKPEASSVAKPAPKAEVKAEIKAPAKTAPVPQLQAAPLPKTSPVDASDKGAKPTTVASGAAATTAAPALLPAETAIEQPTSTTEMKLALDDANAQVALVSETNHRLKLRMEGMGQEIETLKAQLVDQVALQKELAALKAAQPVAEANVPSAAEAPASKGWLMDLLASPLNLAMIILLPVLLVLALVTLWLRARARRELEAQEKSLSDSTAAYLDNEQSEFDDLLVAEMPLDSELLDEDAPRQPAPTLDDELDLFESQDHADEMALHQPEPDPVHPSASQNEPELPVEHLSSAAFDPWATEQEEASHRVPEDMPPPARDEDEQMLTPELDFSGGEDDGVFDLSDLDAELDRMLAEQEVDVSLSADKAEKKGELSQAPSSGAAASTDPNEAAMADFEEAFKPAEPTPLPDRAAAQETQFVDIDSLLAEVGAERGAANLSSATDDEQDPFAEPHRLDMEEDDGGIGAKLDLARAYLEIDDKESARELLEEAVAEGSGSQLREAQKLLKRLT